MELNLNFNTTDHSSDEMIVISAYEKTIPAKGKTKESKAIVNNHWTKSHKEAFASLKGSADYTGSAASTFSFHDENGTPVYVVGLGEKKGVELECLRRSFASLIKALEKKAKHISVSLDGFIVKGKLEDSLSAIVEGLDMTSYAFDKHLSKKKEAKLKTITFDSKEKKTKLKKAQAAIDNTRHITESISVARDFVNEPPNVLNSETYAKAVEKDIKGVKGVKVKVLGKKELKKEKMGLFLSVNSGSGYDPKLVHLTYTPKKVTSKTKHICLVGKGLTFDTGGYSLKPSGSMINMKFDMAGSATVYGAFRAAALMEANVKITCILGMTDNAVNSFATMPDAVCTARNGKTVEILNTDAEGRLVLADCLDYACDLKPDAIIDAATLTGAVLVSLGHETCGIMGNNKKLTSSLLKSAKNTDEYMWELPIIKEFHDDLKSNIADLKNIGGSRFGGSSKAAAFLQNFIKNDIAWAHLDIAGIGDSQGHLPYCPKKGASGLIVRTLVDYINNA